MDITFPLNGWDTNHARDEQPDGTSPDLLNVVPFDRDFRGRGAVRPGLSKFLSTQLGSGQQPVLLVQEVTRALDPSTITPSTELVNEPFTYADNTNVNAINGGNDWRVSRSTSTTYFPFDTTGNFLKVKSNKVVVENATGTTMFAAVYKPTVVLGAAFVIRATISVSGTQGTDHAADAFALLTRINTSSFDEEGIAFVVAKDGCFLRRATANIASFSFSENLSTGDHIIEIHINGDAISGWVDGTLFVAVTDTTNSGEPGIGFALGGNLIGSDSAGLSNFEVFAGAPLASFRETDIVAVCGGNIYVGDTSSIAVASSGSNVLSEIIKPQMASSAGICYFVDSQHNLQTLNLATKTVADIVPTAGSETATTLGEYSLACLWRDRLVLAASPDFPQNFVMSRQSTHTDFDYGQTDSAAAVAGNASKAGAIGEPLNCLIPWTDDILILGGDHSIYKVEGDIAAGGQILLVSDSVGTLGPDCWDADPSGNLYFVGSGGLYKMSQGTLPQNLANASVRKIFANINRVTTYVVLTWDRDRNGLHIHLTPVNTGSTMHIYYDGTTGGFFPIQYPDTVGPITATVFDGDGPLDRQLLLAGRDGYIRKADPTALTDDGTDITSFVNVGPYRPGGDAALSVLEALEVMLGDAPEGFTESDFEMVLTIITGKDAFTALNSPEKSVSFTFTQQARRKRLLQRISGGTFFFKFSGVSGKLWAMEKLVALFTNGGLQRRY